MMTFALVSHVILTIKQITITYDFVPSAGYKICFLDSLLRGKRRNKIIYVAIKMVVG